MSDGIAAASLCDIADRIASREVSATEVTENALRHARRLQPALNAFISLDEEGALAMAADVDSKIARGETPGPLAGVPLAHKDMYYREGKISTCGSLIQRDTVADRTATTLARLHGAGAVYLGGLNMSEFAVGPFGTNVHYGNCHNPWNLDHSPGGSSSGSGASVSARIAYGALGSDTGGSIRIPSALCGVVGIKPTQGRVSRYGLMPLSYSFDTAGPLTRTVRDAARIFDIIAGHDPRDPTSSTHRAGGYEAACGPSVKGLRVGIPENYFYEQTTAEVDAALAAAQSILRDLGADLVPVRVPEHDNINLVWAAALAAEAATIHRKWLRERPQDYGALVRRRIEFGLYQPATRYIEALTLRDSILRDYCATAFADCDVLLTPTAPIPAPLLGQVDVGDSKDMPRLVLLLSRCTRPISYLGLPALSVPCGFAGSHLPVGMQLIGRPFAEATLFRLGHAYQEATRWHLEAPPNSAVPAP
jgi:aspartyl-tRNA(Asn)/glutamyl-tRNA(Gln) amidotransferase subunit A